MGVKDGALCPNLPDVRRRQFGNEIKCFGVR
jgi:hypothetical protein